MLHWLRGPLSAKAFCKGILAMPDCVTAKRQRNILLLLCVCVSQASCVYTGVGTGEYTCGWWALILHRFLKYADMQ